MRRRFPHLRTLLSAVVVGTALGARSLPSQEPVDEAAINKIKAEGLERSQVMETAS